MKSWKARLLVLATMLAMLIALAAPAAMADDWEDAAEYCWYRTDTWEEYEDCVEWYLEHHGDDDDDDDDDWDDEDDDDDDHW